MPDEEKTVTPETESKTDLTAKDRRLAQRAERKKERELKKEYARQKREYEERRRVIPIKRRTLICPPDKAIDGRGKLIFGYAARIFVILIAVFAMTLFTCDAFGFTRELTPGVEPVVSKGFIFLWSLAFTLVLSLTVLLKPRAVFIPVGAAASLGLLALNLLPDPIMKPYEASLTAFNAARDYMAKLGYYALNQHPVPVTHSTGSEDELIRAAVVIFIFLIAVIYTLCLLRRVGIIRLLCAGIPSAAIIFLVFEYNITRGNWGTALLIAAFGAALVMAAYDGIYLKRRKAAITDNETAVFASDEPPLPSVYAEKENRRLERLRQREEKKELRKKRREMKKHPAEVTVEEELNDYFSGKPKKQKKAKEAKPKLTPAEKKAAKAQKKADRKLAAEKKRKERKELADYRAYRRSKTDAACATGGFAGVGAFVLCLIILVIPALTANGPFRTVEAVDKKFEYYREYVTALLMGDDPALDTLAYEGERGNFESRATEPTAKYFKGEKYFDIESNSRNNIYLRGWVATDYDDETGRWLTAQPDSETLDAYRMLFQTYIDPSETMMELFWKYLEPGSVPDPAEKDYTKTNKSNTSLGFVISQVNVRRYELKTKTLYLPAFTLRGLMPTEKQRNGTNAFYLREFGGSETSGLSYADFFDGIYSSYRASLNRDGYAAVAMMPTMKTSGFYRTMADDIASLNLARAAILTAPETDENGEKKQPVTLTLTDGSTLTYWYETRDAYKTEVNEETGESVTYSTGPDGYRYIVVQQEVGQAVYRIDDKNEVTYKVMENVPEVDENGEALYFRAPELPFAIRYWELMSEEERGEFNGYLRILDFYSDYVYSTYTKKSSSQIVKDLTAKVLAEATKNVTEYYEEYDEELEETFELSRTVEVHADYTGAEKSNVYVKGKDVPVLSSAVCDTETYRLRHELVMMLVDYLADENNFTYTLYPALCEDESLVGIEKFIAGPREGSCIQYATTLVLMLREIGIPARYVDGYIAQNLVASRGDEYVASYHTTVKDRNAHAWVEVWYDGVGWVLYEATPPYYNAMYEIRSDDPDRPNYNHTGGDSEDDEGEDDPSQGLTDEELRQLEEERLAAERRALIKKIVTITLIVLAAAALIALFFLYFWTGARKAQKKRDELVARIAATENGEPASREDFRALIDLTRLMISTCGLSPKTGEFREEYAERLTKTCRGALAAASESEKLSEVARAQTVMSEARVLRMLEGIAAEEFGYGCPAEDMHLLARFYRRIHDFEYKHVNIFTRIWLWLFVHKL